MSVEEWKEVNLVDIADIVMGQSPKGETCNNNKIGVPLLNGPTEFGLSYPTAVQWTVDARKQSIVGDILFCVRGSTTGRMNWSNASYAIGRGLAAIRHKKGIKYNYFIKAILDYKLENILASATGSTFPNVGKDILNSLIVNTPSLPEQCAIAKTLSCLDDMIELNNRTNQLLEERAQAIFKRWFVDFEFPNKDGEPYKSSGGIMVESELGEIPKGWSVGMLTDIAKEIICGKTPPTKDKDNYGNYMPFITIPDMHNNIYVIKTERYLSKIGVDTQPQKVLPKNSVCVSCIATAGLVCLTSEDSQTNQQINSVICNEDYSCFYTYFSLSLLSEHIKMLGSSGSTTNNLNKTQFSKIKILINNQEIQKQFQLIVEPIFTSIKENELESDILVAIRNTLLPKLMSGEIRVPVEEVV